jgi:Spy/CpxP family protein refolding chaperone
MTIRRLSLAAAAVLSLSTFVPVAARAQDAAAAPKQDPAATGKAGKRAGKRGQNGGGARAMRNSPVDAAFKAVSPTAEQTTKFEAMQTKFRSDAREQLQTITDARERTAKTRELNQKYRASVEAILTPEQAKQFKTEFALATVLPRLNALDLTAEQLTKVKPAIQDTAVQIEAAQSDTTLRGRQKNQKLTGLFDELKAKLKPLLTAEQQTKLEGMAFAPAGRRNAAAATTPAPAAGAAAPAPANP